MLLIYFVMLHVRTLILGLVGTVLGIVSFPIYADMSVLELFIGEWNVRVKTLQPMLSEVAYVEMYSWVLDHKFIQGKTSEKSDGTSEVAFATYDPQSKGYPFWVFSSTGSYTYLAPGKWDAVKRTLEWRNPPGFDISYLSSCTFPDVKSRVCTVMIKDWKGKVLLEQEIHAFRRDD